MGIAVEVPGFGGVKAAYAAFTPPNPEIITVNPNEPMFYLERQNEERAVPGYNH